MGTDIDYKSLFNEGLKYKQQNRYLEAIEYLKKACNSPEYREKALSALDEIYIALGNLKLARDVFNSKKSSITRSTLERVEYNYDAALKSCGEEFMESEAQYKTLYSLAIINFNLGNYELAIKIFETLQFETPYSKKATFYLVRIYIIFGDLRKALEILNTINYSKLLKKATKAYQNIYLFLLFHLGYNIGSKEDYDSNREYDIYRLFSKDNKYLIQNAKKNNIIFRGINQRFLEDTDLEKIIETIEKEIEDMNPRFCMSDDSYIVRIGSPIGLIGDEIASDVEVRTTMGTKDIIAIKPIILSEEFDKEGLSHSSELALKRKRGINNGG